MVFTCRCRVHCKVLGCKAHQFVITCRWRAHCKVVGRKTSRGVFTGRRRAHCKVVGASRRVIIFGGKLCCRAVHSFTRSLGGTRSLVGTRSLDTTELRSILCNISCVHCTTMDPCKNLFGTIISIIGNGRAMHRQHLECHCVLAMVKCWVLVVKLVLKLHKFHYVVFRQMHTSCWFS